MITPKEICEELVPQIAVTGEDWFFFYGSRRDINFDADDKTDSVSDENGDQQTVTYPAAVLSKPVTLRTTRYKSGYAESVASLLMFFLYDPDQDETREVKEALVKKARQAAEEMVKRLRAFDTHIASVGTETITDLENFTDRKCWGVTLGVDVTIKNLDGECLTNINNDIVTIIDQDGNLIGTPECRTTFVVTTAGMDTEVQNSDSSYTQSGDSPIILPDETYNIFVNGELDQIFNYPTLKALEINIEP